MDIPGHKAPTDEEMVEALTEFMRLVKSDEPYFDQYRGMKRMLYDYCTMRRGDDLDYEDDWRDRNGY